jgi:hypothetical protein
VPLLELIWQLPAASRLNEAQLNDPEVAEQIALAEIEREEAEARGELPREQWAPRVRDYDLHAMLLREIREAVLAVRASQFETTLVPAGEGKQKPMKAPSTPLLPGPRTAVDRIKAERSRRAQFEIIALFAPKHASQFFTQ